MTERETDKLKRQVEEWAEKWGRVSTERDILQEQNGILKSALLDELTKGCSHRPVLYDELDGLPCKACKDQASKKIRALIKRG